jgi:hypothetical protein
LGGRDRQLDRTRVAVVGPHVRSGWFASRLGSFERQARLGCTGTRGACEMGPRAGLTAREIADMIFLHSPGIYNANTIKSRLRLLLLQYLILLSSFPLWKRNPSSVLNGIKVTTLNRFTQKRLLS